MSDEVKTLLTAMKDATKKVMKCIRVSSEFTKKIGDKR
jgi:hypothetical protein